MLNRVQGLKGNCVACRDKSTTVCFSANRCPPLESHDHVNKSSSNTSAGVVVVLRPAQGYTLTRDVTAVYISCLAIDLVWNDTVPFATGRLLRLPFLFVLIYLLESTLTRNCACK